MIIQILIFVIFVAILFRLLRKPDGLPPGEWGWPIIGKLPSKGKAFHDFIKDMRRKHGDIFCVKTGYITNVFLCNYELIKEAFSKPEYSSRPPFFTLWFFSYFKNLGLIFSLGEQWKTCRRFTLSHLRDFGLGTSRMDSVITMEVEAALDYFDTKLDEPFKVNCALNVAVLNVTWGLVAARRYDMDDEEIGWFSELISRNLSVIDGPMALLNFFPWLNSLLPNIVKTKWMKIDFFEQSRGKLHKYIEEIIVEHEKELDNEKPRDYIDSYLIEMQKGESEIFTVENLIVSVTDLFIAGSETTSSTLRWFFLYMATHQDVQERAYKDISNVISSDRLPSLDDKAKLPYVEAMIHEINRCISFLPFALPHQTSEDCVIQGFKIPKGTVVHASVESCHKNPRHWKKADDFYPEHFLDDEGKFSTPKDGYLPFSIGRRQCLGESVAKMVLFLFSTAILHRYQILPPEGEKLSLERERDAHFISCPPQFNIVLKKRE